MKIADAYRKRAETAGAAGRRIEARRLRRVADRLVEIDERDTLGEDSVA